MKVLLLLSMAVSAEAAVPDPITGRYVVVTETEYSITLTLEPKGAAEFEFLTWEANGSAPEHHQRFFGTWYRHAGRIIVLLASGKTATFVAVPCLSHQDFGEVGCSPEVLQGCASDNHFNRTRQWLACLALVAPGGQNLAIEAQPMAQMVAMLRPRCAAQTRPLRPGCGRSISARPPARSARGRTRSPGRTCSPCA